MQNNNLDLSKDDFALFLNGDQRIFRLIFDHYYSLIHCYVRSISRQPQDFDDIVQQTFIQLFKHKSAIQDPSGLYPYLLVISKRLVIMSFRKRVLQAKYRSEAIHRAEVGGNKTEKQIEFNELQAMLTRFIDKLPPKQREVYRLSKVDGYSYDEISIMTGTSKNTIKNHLVTASKKIKALIFKHYFIFFLYFLFD